MGEKCWWYIQNERGSNYYKNVKLRHAQEHVAGSLRKKSTLSHTQATKKKDLSFQTEVAFKTQNRRPHQCGCQHHLPRRNQKMFIVIAKFINATMSCGELEWTLRRQWQLHVQSLDWMWWMIAIPQELLAKCLVWIEGSYFRRCGARKGGSQTFIHSPFCGHTIIILADSYMKVLRQKLIMCRNCNHCNFKLDFNLCKSDDRSNFYDRYAFNLDSNNCNSSFNYCKSDDHSDLCDHYAFNLDSNNRNSTFISRLSGRSKGPNLPMTYWPSLHGVWSFPCLSRITV